MIDFDYSPSGIDVREDLREAHRFLWEHLGAPGTWWSGEQRVAIAAVSRSAPGCSLCRQRKTALSPNAVSGTHDAPAGLPEEVIDVIHRIRVDPAGLSHEWLEQVLASGLAEAEYVELVGVVTLLAGVDYFARALGIQSFPLPDPAAGEPTRRVPACAKRDGAWVAMIAAEDAVGPEADLYGDMAMVPNIMRALSSVPDEARALQRSSNAHYVHVTEIADPTVRKSIDRMQMELVAARVSALNECFY